MKITRVLISVNVKFNWDLKKTWKKINKFIKNNNYQNYIAL